MRPLPKIDELRRRANVVAAEAFFNYAAKVGRLHPQAQPERHGVEVLHDIRYLASDHAEHHLDVYRPRRVEGLLPIVLYIHGGGFQILSKDSHWLMGLAFARQGYVVFNVSYRLAPRHRFPAAIGDVCAAFEWVVANAARYGGDVSRLVVAGESAGANLAVSLTLATTYPRTEPFARAVYQTGVVPVATLPACGIFQVSDIQRFRRGRPGVPRFIQDHLDAVERNYIGADPSSHGELLDFADVLPWLERGDAPGRPLPAFLLTVGTKDPLLPDTRRLTRALRALGATVEACYYPGEPHAFHAFVFRKNARRCWRDHFAFLQKQLD
jgi:acetyl esterase